MFNFHLLILLKFLNNFNYKATAIYTLTFGIEVVIYAIFSGTSKGTMTLMGQCIGAGKRKEANGLFYQCMLINVFVVAMAMLVFVMWPKQLLSIFSKDGSIIEATVPFLIFTAVIMFPKSLNVVIGNAVRAYGDTRWMFISQVIGSIFVVSCSYILVQIVHLHVVAIYVTLFLDEMIRASINYFHFVCCYKNENQGNMCRSKMAIEKI